MTTGNPLLVHDAIVALDYGQFCLCGSYGPSADYQTYLEEALRGDRIAGNRHAVVVCSPHQNNFEMPLRVEVWERLAPDDHDDWEEIFQCDLLVDDDGLRYQSPTLDQTVFDVPAGSYTLLICGRGFVNHGWPGSTTPGDGWRIQMWTSTDNRQPTTGHRPDSKPGNSLSDTDPSTGPPPPQASTLCGMSAHLIKAFAGAEIISIGMDSDWVASAPGAASSSSCRGTALKP